jgi:hypothetical protein
MMIAIEKLSEIVDQSRTGNPKWSVDGRRRLPYMFCNRARVIEWHFEGLDQQSFEAQVL